MAVGEGLGDVGAADLGGSGEVGDGSCDAEDAGEAAGGEAEAGGGLFGEGAGFGLEVDGVEAGFGVGGGTVFSVAGALPGAGGGHAGGDGVARFAGGGAGEFGRGDGVDVDDEVDAVQQGSADAAEVVFAAAGGLVAFARGVAEVASAAGVHGSDELEAGRVGDVGCRAGDGGLAGFERLAEGFEGRAGKLGQFV